MMLRQVQAAAIKEGAIKAVPLPVAGAFHTPLMEPARAALIKARSPASHGLVLYYSMTMKLQHVGVP